jgi:hypothetical protein
MSDPLAHARQLLARSELPRIAGLPAVRGGPELIRYLMNCSAYVRPFVVVAEAHGDRLRMRRNEVVQAGSYGGAPVSAAALGSFSFDAADWPGCPHCGARDNPAHDLRTFWMCSSCGGFNCAGTDRLGSFRCACGNITSGGFYSVEKFAVRGVRAAASATPRAAPSPAGAIRPALFVAPAPVAPNRFSAPPLPAPQGPPPLRLPGRK